MWSVGSRWVAVDGIPVFIRARPEFEESLHPREVDVVDIAGCRMEFMPLRIFVGVVVADECEVIERAQVERVLPA